MSQSKRIDPDQNLIVLVGNALVLYIHVPTIFICSVLILQMLNVLCTDLFSRTFLLFFSKQHKTFKIKWYCLCIKEMQFFWPRGHKTKASLLLILVSQKEHVMEK